MLTRYPEYRILCPTYFTMSHIDYQTLVDGDAVVVLLRWGLCPAVKAGPLVVDGGCGVVVIGKLSPAVAEGRHLQCRPTVGNLQNPVDGQGRGLARAAPPPSLFRLPAAAGSLLRCRAAKRRRPRTSPCQRRRSKTLGSGAGGGRLRWSSWFSDLSTVIRHT